VIGDLTTAIREAELYLEVAQDIGYQTWIGTGNWMLGEALLDLDEPQRARTALELSIAVIKARDARGALPEVHARCARACIRLRDLAAADEHITAARGYLISSDHESIQITGVAAAELAEARGNLAEADSLFRETLLRISSTGWVYKIAETELLYGAFLVRNRRLAEARGPLIAARSRYGDPLAYRGVEQIDALLAEIAITP